MTPLPINKDVNQDDLNKVAKALFDQENYFKEELQLIHRIEASKRIFLKSSHYILSIVNRAISLNRGFLQLANSNNYQTAIALIRLQIDNCLRLYAMSLVNNTGEFFDQVLSGVEIRDLKDRDGNKMTDSFLVKRINSIFPEFMTLYKNTSGFVHFSKEHLFFNTELKNFDDESFKIVTTVGGIESLEVFKKVDYTFNMFMAGKCLFEIIKEYRVTLNEMYSE